MKESKLDLANRLRNDGRWPEASLWKDEKIKELRAAGMKRPEAQLKAWEATEQKYPPVEISEVEEEEPGVGFSVEQIAALPSGSLEEFAADVGWVYSSLGSGDTYTEDPPSTGAVALLEWARANKEDFFSKIVPKALQILKNQPDQDAAAAEMERLNREHSDNLFERAMGLEWLEDHNQEFNAVHALKEAKGFTEDTLGFAAYLRGLAGADG